MKEIIIFIAMEEHDKVILLNKNGDTFTFNPMTENGEQLNDFLLM